MSVHEPLGMGGPVCVCRLACFVDDSDCQSQVWQLFPFDEQSNIAQCDYYIAQCDYIGMSRG